MDRKQSCPRSEQNLPFQLVGHRPHLADRIARIILDRLFELAQCYRHFLIGQLYRLIVSGRVCRWIQVQNLLRSSEFQCKRRPFPHLASATRDLVAISGCSNPSSDPVQTHSQNDVLRRVPGLSATPLRPLARREAPLDRHCQWLGCGLAAISVQTIQLLGKQLPHVNGPQIKNAQIGEFPQK